MRVQLNQNLSYYALLTEKVVKLLTTFAMGALIARAIGPVDYGAYSLCYTIFAIFQTLGLGGIDHIFVREYQHTQDTAALVRSALRLRVRYSILAVALSLLACLTLGMFSQNIAHGVAALLIQTALTLVPFEVGDLANQAQSRAYRSALTRSIASVSAASLRLLTIYMYPSIVVLAATVLIEYGISGGIYWRKCLRPILKDDTNAWPHSPTSDAERKFSTAEQKSLLFAALCSILYGRIDQIVVFKFVGSGVLGIYSVAATLMSFTFILATSFVITRYPTICRIGATDPLTAERMISRTSTSLAIFGTIVGAAIYALSLPAIAVVYGRSYEGSAELLKIMAIGIPFAYFGLSENMRVLLHKRGKVLLLKNAIGTALIAGLSLAGVMYIGVAGAAAAVATTYFLADFVFYLAIRHRLTTVF